MSYAFDSQRAFRVPRLADCPPINLIDTGQNNGVQILDTLRSLAINALRLDGIWSITEGIAVLDHDIKGMLKLLGWRPATETSSG